MQKTESRNKPLILIIGLLMLSNIILLTVLIMNNPSEKKNDKPGKTMSEYLKTDLQYSDQQMLQYDSLKARHRRTMKGLYDSLRAKKQTIFKGLGAVQFADSNVQAATKFASGEQKQIELQMLHYIKGIREIG